VARGDAKHAVLGRAWAFALPSYFEGMPMSILEAMAAGVPVVATNVGGIPMAVDERCGVLIPPRDAARLSQSLIEILGDASRRKAMGAAARERAARHFSAAALVPRVEQVWEEIVGSPNGLNPVFSPGHG
jgi:glycosyltransferase involved in cell wall biosynthesis